MNVSYVLPKLFMNIGLEAAVVGVVCIIFLMLFIVAAIVQMKKEKDKHPPK